jgi:hypothetical protein
LTPGEPSFTIYQVTDEGHREDGVFYMERV